jgi:twitching motility protein PilT
MIDYINKTHKKHIITVEDPIEFAFKSEQSLINQREVGNHTKGFAPAIRAALREDPDVIMI